MANDNKRVAGFFGVVVIAILVAMLWLMFVEPTPQVEEISRTIPLSDVPPQPAPVAAPAPAAVPAAQPAVPSAQPAAPVTQPTGPATQQPSAATPPVTNVPQNVPDAE